MSYEVTPIPCLSDNYAYALECKTTHALAIIDPSEASPVLQWLHDKRPGQTVSAIWNTHHHPDHVGGNVELAAAVSPKEVVAYASDKGRIPGQTKMVHEGDTFKLGDLDVEILHIPGHTTGAIAYVVRSANQGKTETAVFTGDTLFLSGCGRLFEGTPLMMHASLQKLAKLPADTNIYCGHEYTVSNLKFAIHVEPTNADAKARLEKATAARTKNEPTVPGTMKEELATNPFLRVNSAEIRKTLKIDLAASEGDALGMIRAAKDSFKT
jgi:hydroxyacylglutathione hydrolase